MRFNKNAAWFGFKVNVASLLFTVFVFAVLGYLMPRVLTPLSMPILSLALMVAGYALALDMLLKTTPPAERQAGIAHALYVYLIWGVIGRLLDKHGFSTLSLSMFALGGLALYILSQAFTRREGGEKKDRP